MTSAPIRDTSGFSRASHQSQALCYGAIAAGCVLQPMAQWGFDGFRGPLSFLVAGIGLGFAVAGRHHWKLHTMAEMFGYSSESEIGSVIPQDSPLLYGQIQSDKLLRRLVKVAESRFPEKFVLDPENIEYETGSDGRKDLVSWGFTCVESGFLASTALQQKIQKTFLTSLGGVWSFKFDPMTDTFGATRKSTVPKLVFPQNWHVVSSPAEARKLYPGWEVKVGVSQRGVEGLVPQKMAHIMCIGESGSGKSVSVRSWLEQFRAAGWQLIIADGKGPDYTGYSAPHEEDNGLPVPGTVAVGLGSATHGMAYVGAITLAYQVMQGRQANSIQEKIDNPDGWSDFAPVLLVMDEIKGMREKWKSTLSRSESKAIESMVTEILALGREFRVHVLLVSQDARDVSIPGTWKSNIPGRICLGKPQKNTLTHGFQESIQGKVRMITDAMDPKIKGRCVIAVVDEESGAADAVEYQGYLSYAPGESWDNANIPSEAKEKKNWPSFKENVSDRVPRMYNRQWFRIDEKPAAQIAAEEKSGVDAGYIDFDLFTVDEIKKLERVGLDMRLGDGSIVPDPDRAKYDPSSKEYVCRQPAHAQTVAEEL